MSLVADTSLGAIAGTSQYLRAHPVVARALPAPEETWTAEEAPAPVDDALHKLLAKDVIGRVDRGGSYPGTYRTHAAAYRFAREHVPEPTTLPCGHTGIRNYGGGRYGCGRADCDARVDRATAREVLEG